MFTYLFILYLFGGVQLRQRCWCFTDKWVGGFPYWGGRGRGRGGIAEGGAGQVAVEGAWVRLLSRATTGLRPGVEWTCRLCL